MYVRIHTLDWFWSAAESVRNIIAEGKCGNFPLPMCAKSHHDLTNGLPESANEYLKNPYVTHNREIHLKYRLDERKYKGLEQNEFSE